MGLTYLSSEVKRGRDLPGATEFARGDRVRLEAILTAVAALFASACATDLSVEKGHVFAQPAGETLKLNVYAPKEEAEAPRPAVLVIHGGGWRFGSRTQQLFYCHEFARNGYVVFTIDYRLMPNSCFPACVHDCKAAVRWIRLNAGKYNVDPDRIAAFGASAGGHLAAMLGTTSPPDGLEGTENPGPPTNVQAVISLYGAVDLTKYRDRRAESRFARGAIGYLDRFVGTEVKRAGWDPFECASPVCYASSSSPPMLLIHGTSDWAVPYAASEAMYERLQALGVPTRLITVPNRNHGFDYVDHRLRRLLFNEMLAFLDKHMNGESPQQTDLAASNANTATGAS